MKTCLKWLLLLQFLVTYSAFGQGTFLFQNFHPVGLDAPVFDADGNRLMGTNYLAILLGGATPDSLAVAQSGSVPMSPQSFSAIFHDQPGYFAKPGHVIVPTARLAWLQVRAWDARLGATYEDVVGLGLGGYGESVIFQALGGDIEPTGLPPQPLRGLQSFSLVPEPTTWALLAFGFGFLCWQLRKPR